VFDETIIAAEDRALINTVIKDARDYSNSTLVDITRKQTPWLNSYSKNKTNVISTQLIRHYFLEKNKLRKGN